MTAEIAVMNKDAVALAADSTITVSGKKTYVTTNKLFALSRHAPVGIMVYGSSEIGGVPWEILVKEYRRQLGKKTFRSLDGYRKDFFEFINGITVPYDDDEFFDDAIEHAEDFLERLMDELDGRVKSVISNRGSITPAGVKRTLGVLIREFHSKYQRARKLSVYSPKRFQAVQIIGREIFPPVIKSKLENHSVSTPQQRLLQKAIWYYYFSRLKSNSGIVLAGYGKGDIFPGLISCSVEGVVIDAIKYKHESVSISHNLTAAIRPYAEAGAARTFVNGISEGMFELVASEFSSALNSLVTSAQELTSNKGKATSLSKSVGQKLRASMVSMEEEFHRKLGEHMEGHHVNPLLEAVQFLPKIEMAEVAEALVAITSFRQKISLEKESVGGAIDVAVISKADGFIWIKRKHYFDPDMNLSYTNQFVNRSQKP